jgi:hypothetical protein
MGSHQGRVRERGAPSASSDRAAASDTPAKRFYADSGYGEPEFEPDELSAGGWEWERPERSDRDTNEGEATGARSQGTGFFAKIARTVEAAKGALSFRGAEHDEEYPEPSEQTARPTPDRQRYVPASLDDTPSLDDAGDSVQYGDAYAEAHDATADTQRTGREPRATFEPRQTTGPRPEGADWRPPRSVATETPERPTGGAPQRTVVVDDSEADTMDQHGPPMWDLGEGDLRQRMIRFLQHPDVPVILRTEMVARNFGLGEEVADAMLEDLTNDKIDGLVVTKVRDETYRISRAPTKL